MMLLLRGNITAIEDSIRNMNEKNKIAIVTTARSDFNTVKPLAESLLRAGFDCGLIVGGMHFLETKGFSKNEIIKTGIPIFAELDFFCDDPNMTPSLFLEGLSKCQSLAAKKLKILNLDLLVITGDRLENIPIMMSALLYQIKMLHVCGGDETKGSLDNIARNLMSNFATYHCVSMLEHQQKLISLGVKQDRVVITGDPGIDELHNTEIIEKEALRRKLGINTQNFCILIYHPETNPYHYKLNSILSGLEIYSTTNTVLYVEPNIDPSDVTVSRGPIGENFSYIANLEPSLFYNALHYCDFIIGNSSAGIWESPSFGTPAINIGSRQDGRKRNRNIIDVESYDPDQIRLAIGTQLSRGKYKNLKNHFGDGSASKQILEVIKGI